MKALAETFTRMCFSEFIYTYKDVHKKKTSMSSLNLYFFSSILDAFRRYGHRQENEFLQGYMPIYITVTRTIKGRISMAFVSLFSNSSCKVFL